MNKYLFIFTLQIFSWVNAWQLVEYKPELFSQPRVPTEYSCYRYAKEHNNEFDATYVAFPWAALINANRLAQLPQDAFVHHGITVCQHTEFNQIIPYLQRIGVEVLFTPHVDKNTQYPITVLPIALFPVNAVDPAPRKDILYSFIGASWTHPTRRKICDLPLQPDVYIKERRQWHFYLDSATQELHEQEYKTIIARSRFGLCPLGYGPSTIRFWELLKSGTIPVLIGDMVLPHFDWDNTIVRIAESDIKNVDTIIRNIDESTENKMRKNCHRAYEQFCGENIISPILDYFKHRQEDKSNYVYQESISLFKSSQIIKK